MPSGTSFTFTDPNGKSYTVNGPDGATQDQAWAMLQQQLKGQQTQQPQSSTLDKVGGFVKDMAQSGGRQLMNAAVGIPGVFADGTAGAANVGADLLGAKRPFPVMPSEDFKQRLSPVLGERPAGAAGLPEDIGSAVIGSKVPLPGAPAGGLPTAQAADQAGGTAGMQSGNSFVQALESTLARLPGGGALVRAMHTATDKVSDMSDSIVRNLSGGADTSATGAGKVLDQQIAATGTRAKQVAKEGFDQLDAMLPEKALIPPQNTVQTLKSLTSVPPGAANTMGAITSPKLLQIRTALEQDLKDAEGGGLPYGTLKAVRSQIGQQIDWGPFSTNPDNGALKLVYGALSKDLTEGAKGFGPEVAAIATKVNADYAAAKNTQEVLESVVGKAGGPEKVFTSLLSGTKEGSTTLDTVLSNIDPQSKKVLAASTLQRMGRATANNQGVTSDTFSASSFLTNWSKMSPEARSSLFGSLPDGYADSVTQLANNVAKLKAYSKVLPNSSNTAQAALWGGEVASGLTALLTGHWQVAASVAGTAAGTKVIATALTNPQTTAYLAKQTTLLAAKAAGAARQSTIGFPSSQQRTQ